MCMVKQYVCRKMVEYCGEAGVVVVAKGMRALRNTFFHHLLLVATWKKASIPRKTTQNFIFIYMRGFIEHRRCCVHMKYVESRSRFLSLSERAPLHDAPPWENFIFLFPSLATSFRDEHNRRRKKPPTTHYFGCVLRAQKCFLFRRSSHSQLHAAWQTFVHI